MNVVFPSCLFLATAALAVWLGVRFPRLAPTSTVWRGAGMLLSGFLLQYLPIWTGSYLALYASVFLVVLPVLTLAWLFAYWFLQGIAGQLTSMRR